MSLLDTARADLRLGRRLATLRAGTLGLAALGDPVARLFQAPWKHDPYAVHERLRCERRLTWSRSGIWVASTYDDAHAVLRDRRFGVRLANGQQPFDVTGGPVHEGTEPDVLEMSLLGLDPPDHGRLRRLATPAFSARRIEAVRPQVEATATRLLDALDPARGPVDLVASYASPLPVAVISDLLAIPPQHARQFAAWGSTLGASLDGVTSVPHHKRLLRAQADLRALFERLVAERRADPGEDLLSRLATAADGPDAVTADEVVALAQLLLLAGFETTTNLVGNAVHALLQHPDQLAMATEDPSLAGRVITETLRWDPPVQLTARVAHEPVRVGPVDVRRDQVVLVLLGSTGRDEAVHGDADVFDLTRPEGRDTLAFSGGAHYCVGAPLARLEGEVALRLLLERWPGVRRAARPRPRGTTVIRGWRTLPVRA
ncbi:cytochrome P450 [Nocardioides aurantiacus]|uniref:Cytochrome P450 n=1 Tax=Nocardioides aurantiacus TaxID=86796 RepID=A0A3N2CZR4_9ACTN|nr:cytochrome P450 [Nocardioides aurantiacus]ROR93009.1 hypothetical protein EDD33_3914 [Nocardioides aurantiacus]